MARRSPKEKQQFSRRVSGVFSVEEAAAILEKPRRTIYRWEAKGKMPPRITVGGVRKYYRRAEILAMAGSQPTSSSEVTVSAPSDVTLCRN